MTFPCVGTEVDAVGARQLVHGLPTVVEREIGNAELRIFRDNFAVLTEAGGGTTRLRELVRALAVRGALVGCPSTGTQDSEISETDAFQIPHGWRWVELDELCADSFYGPRFGKNEYVSSGGVPTIRTTDMDDGGNIVLRDSTSM